jgi:hypothetical protein
VVPELVEGTTIGLVLILDGVFAVLDVFFEFVA